MPVSYPVSKAATAPDIELPSVQRNCLKALKQAGKKSSLSLIVPVLPLLYPRN